MRLSFEARYANFRNLAESPGDGVVVPFPGPGLDPRFSDSDDGDDIF